MKDEKSAAKFHYIKTVSGKVVEHSIAFRTPPSFWLLSVVAKWWPISATAELLLLNGTLFAGAVYATEILSSVR